MKSAQIHPLKNAKSQKFNINHSLCRDAAMVRNIEATGRNRL
jgi:hypothetical protein